ncbi:uncharacterized protein LOC100906499 [Galendromus occidentalis]|uniref:Uncharacterized protein LOC100906499 n=1 Tax=Galendromus occidentalis TaxID=34638 RepID=A0AAJ6VXB2_9ACAR|nr:uncharacterized protein LOC100906499 [Galendromus occidentalis]
MIRSALVVGVLVVFVAAQFGRDSLYDRRRGFQSYARGLTCFHNASMSTSVNRSVEYEIGRTLRASWRNVSSALEQRQRGMGQNEGAKETEAGARPLGFDFGFRRSRRGNRSEMNQTQFLEALAEVQDLALAEAPSRITNFDTSGAGPFLSQYFLCMEDTRFDENGRMRLF